MANRFWIWNPTRRRLEQWSDEGGTAHIAQAYVDPRVDHSDLQGVVAQPLDQGILGYVDGLFAGDPTSAQFINDLTSSLTAKDQQAGPMVPIRDSAAQVAADAERTGAALGIRADANSLAQTEHQLRQEMLQRGQRPEDFWQRAGVGQGGAGVPQSAGQPMSAYGEITPDYTRAYTAQDRVTAQAVMLRRAEELQRVQNAWDAYKEGADWLGQFGDINRGIREGEQELATAEAFARSDPAQDKNIGWTTDNQTLHSGSMGLAGGLRQARAKRDQMLAARYPDQYMAEQRTRISPTSPDYVLQSWNVQADPSRRMLIDPRTGQPVEAFEGGGQSYLSQNYQGYANVQGVGDQGGEGWSQTSPGTLAAGIESQNAYRRHYQETLGFDQRSADSEIAGIQQQLQQQLAAMAQQHQQQMQAVAARREQMAVEFARQRQALQQGQNVAQHERAGWSLGSAQGGMATYAG